MADAPSTASPSAPDTDSKASSDPIVVLDVMGTSFKSKQMKKELNPVWLESFTWAVEDDEAILEVVVEDYDLTGNDFMGRTSRIAASWTRVHLTSMRVVCFSSLSCFGPRRGVSERAVASMA